MSVLKRAAVYVSINNSSDLDAYVLGLEIGILRGAV